MIYFVIQVKVTVEALICEVIPPHAVIADSKAILASRTLGVVKI
jgi:hypothetical protein